MAWGVHLLARGATAKRPRRITHRARKPATRPAGAASHGGRGGRWGLTAGLSGSCIGSGRPLVRSAVEGRRSVGRTCSHFPRAVPEELCSIGLVVSTVGGRQRIGRSQLLLCPCDIGRVDATEHFLDLTSSHADLGYGPVPAVDGVPGGGRTLGAPGPLEQSLNEPMAGLLRPVRARLAVPGWGSH